MHFDPHLIFPNIFKNHEIFYDKVNIVDKFFYQNYGAHMRPWGSPLAYKGKMCTFENARNPGGHLEIWDIFVRGVWPLMVSANSVSIRYSTIFGYKIILKFPLEIFLPPYAKSANIRNFCPFPRKGYPLIPGGHYQSPPQGCHAR